MVHQAFAQLGDGFSLGGSGPTDLGSLDKQGFVVLIKPFCLQENVVGFVELAGFPGHFGRQEPASFHLRLQPIQRVLTSRAQGRGLVRRSPGPVDPQVWPLTQFFSVSFL